MNKLVIGRKKRDIIMKNGNEGRNVLGDSRKRYRCPKAEIGKYGLRQETIRLQDSLPCPLRKKLNWDIMSNSNSA